jgi:hypothetical protein
MFTAIVFKNDKRTKSGKRQVLNQDYDTTDKATLEHSIKTTWPACAGFTYEIHETIVTRKVLGSGREFKERFDTPHCCSPSSESFWSS